MPRTSRPKDQYQLYIPRFILRSFQDAQIQQRSKKQGQKDYFESHKTGFSNDTVAVYDLKTQVLEQRPIPRTYGVINLHRDEQNPANVNHLEEALSRLENSAAKSIREIQEAVNGGRVELKMSCKELETIRKFLYVMHYCRMSQIPSCFDEKDPDNMVMQDFDIASNQERCALEEGTRVWLSGLKYILDTPHHGIMETGERLHDQYGGLTNMVEMSLRGVDVESKKFHVLDYYLQADATFLAIWIAAQEQEFVVGTHSFGQFEGCFMGIPGLHYLHVVSPTIALVTRSKHLSPEGGPLPQSKYPTMQLDQPTLDAYRQTPATGRNTYTIFPSKLTVKQTHDVNRVFLSNLDTGSVTFASEGAMMASLKHRLQSTLPYIRESKYFLRPLLGLLASNTMKMPSMSIVTAPRNNASAYDMAHMLYHLVTDDVDQYNQVSLEIHTITARAIIKMKSRLPSFQIKRHRNSPLYNRHIVPMLTREDSDLFFDNIGGLVDSFHVNTVGNDPNGALKYSAAIIGFTYWLFEEHPILLLDNLLPDSLTILSPAPQGLRSHLVRVTKIVLSAICQIITGIIGFIAGIFALEHNAPSVIAVHAMGIDHTDVRLDNLLFVEKRNGSREMPEEYSPVQDPNSGMLLQDQPISSDWTFQSSAHDFELLAIYLIDFGHGKY
ncbi:hypothetical protein D9619_010850 [Psilocybe cf. subviscida]|uniref:Uncharacterized protein n=1 Tax=Psilocybe cf. subviscida TaxID=2480587 RepID=A0A8H5B8E9_9AGAR|nr:hypothetical protein D9619_010850 [Psilocybe cf. subviscida]